MPRYIFYLAVGLLAFGISSYSFVKCFFKSAGVTVIAQTSELDTSTNQPKSNQEVPQSKKIITEETAAFEVLKPTIRKWLSGERIKNELPCVQL
jgi:hypothetical protein